MQTMPRGRRAKLGVPRYVLNQNAGNSALYDLQHAKKGLGIDWCMWALTTARPQHEIIAISDAWRRYVDQFGLHHTTFQRFMEG